VKETVMQWEPLGDQILVRPLVSPDRTAGGLFVPDESRERPQRGVVVAVGAGAPAELTGQLRPVSVTLGDLVAFGKYAGVEHDFNGQRVLLMRDQEALARVPEGGYTLVEHTDPRGQVTAHLTGETCEQCPVPARADLSAERAKLLGEMGQAAVAASEAAS
jgi:chaperonin GroES